MTIELAGPAPETINLAGSEETVQFMAHSLLRLCTEGPQMGGFLTAFLSRLVSWALDPTADLTSAIGTHGLDYRPSVVPRKATTKRCYYGEKNTLTVLHSAAYLVYHCHYSWTDTKDIFTR